MSWWAAALGAIAVVLLVIIPAVGALLFRPQRARNVKQAERDPDVIKHVVEVQRQHPEIVKGVRLDRHPWFVVPHVCVFGYSVCVFLGARLTSNVLALGDEARYTMAGCFLIGSAIVLTGVTLGAKIGPWRVAADVHDHITAEAQGDDIVLPYRLSMAGMGAMAVSSSIYTWTSFQNTAGSLGGWLTAGIAALCLSTIALLQRAIVAFQRDEHILISGARARLAGTADAG